MHCCSAGKMAREIEKTVPNILRYLSNMLHVGLGFEKLKIRELSGVDEYEILEIQ